MAQNRHYLSSIALPDAVSFFLLLSSSCKAHNTLKKWEKLLCSFWFAISMCWAALEAYPSASSSSSKRMGIRGAFPYPLFFKIPWKKFRNYHFSFLYPSTNYDEVGWHYIDHYYWHFTRGFKEYFIFTFNYIYSLIWMIDGWNGHILYLLLLLILLLLMLLNLFNSHGNIYMSETALELSMKLYVPLVPQRLFG